MKRTIILIRAVATVALCVMYGCGSETVIVYPEFDNTGADYFSLYKIERADTATIMYADVYHLPTSCLIVKDLN
jgi:hypothetical protein